MTAPRILILGKNGQVGYELLHCCQTLGQLQGVGRDELDCENLSAVQKFLSTAKPALLINAVAYTAVDRAETDRARARLLNEELPAMLASYCARVGIPLVHFSTDYVYDGKGSEPYPETKVPSPLNYYGASKLAGDRRIEESGAAHLIFRTSWVYARRGRNFLRTVLEKWNAGNPLRIVADQVGAPTPAALIAVATARVLAASGPLDKKGAFSDISGIYHLTAGGAGSWFEFASEFLPPGAVESGRLSPIATHEYPTQAVRPSYSVLSTAKLRDRFGLFLPDWRDALRIELRD